ncbi:hypothetical protein BOTBODRAFT_145386 [Botryobasidium botryosum FD-172 SS1]|uniref:F-box domain-containing protein n=1 Tax=Botryobasidium botryosum (strain FD-172 SS1) TaxID=930990 RepID=A0A067MG65_BOTB1|nr:hypothetical protein BOTBODRAFT_145386 [Botryobasidium botryosum FD-172 SS1]
MSSAAPSAIHRLPSELLLEIFLNVYGPTIDARMDWEAKQRAILSLSRVCRMWRKLTHECSSFWAFVKLDPLRPDEDLRAADWIAHTAMRPLCIKIEYRTAKPARSKGDEVHRVFLRLVSVLRRHMSRWVWVSIDAAHPSFAEIFFRDCVGEASMLKALTVRHMPSASTGDVAETPLAIIPGGPFYMTFVEPNRLPPLSPYFGSVITHLSVDTGLKDQDADSFLHALRLCPNLVELHLACEKMRAPQAAAPVSLPHLTRLFAVAAQDILPFLSVSSLHSLSLPQLQWSDSVTESLVRIIRTCPGLVCIGLDHDRDRPEWTPKPFSLPVTTCPYPDIPLPVSGRWRADDRVQDTGPRMTCIKLTFPRLGEVAHTVHPFNQLLDILQADVGYCESLSILAHPELMDFFFQPFTTTPSLTRSVLLPNLVHLYLDSSDHYILPFLELPCLESLHLPQLHWSHDTGDSLLGLFRCATLLSCIVLADARFPGNTYSAHAPPAFIEPSTTLPSVTYFSARGRPLRSESEYTSSALFLYRLALPQVKSLALHCFPLDTVLRLISTSTSQLQHLSLSKIQTNIHHPTDPLLLLTLVSFKTANQDNVADILTQLRLPNLQYLDVSTCQITAATSHTPFHAALLLAVPLLTRLDLDHVGISDGDLVDVLGGLPTLKYLRLAHCYETADAVLHALATPFEPGCWIVPRLEQVELWNNWSTVTFGAVLAFLAVRGKKLAAPNNATGAGLPSVEAYVGSSEPLTPEVEAALLAYGRFMRDRSGAAARSWKLFATFGSAGRDFDVV